MVNDKLAINGGEAVFKHEVKERWNNIYIKKRYK